MKKEQLEKVQAEVSAWAYLNQLSPVEKNFRLKMLMREEGDTFQIYSYENEDLKRSTFSEAVADDQFDFIDNLTNEEDDTSAESEEI